jgi:hypothetical protein
VADAAIGLIATPSLTSTACGSFFLYMKHVRRLLLLPVAALFLGATCVTGVRQHGDAGPWVGEVVNTGDQAVYAAGAQARVSDARGREYYPGRIGVFACPSKLLPGERGAFSLFVPTEDMTPEYILRDPALPLRAEFDAIGAPPIGTGQARGDGLFVEELSRDLAAGTTRIRLTNNGPGAYAEFTVCGIIRTLEGATEGVGRADGSPLPSQLAVGASIELTMQFASLPEGSFDVRYHALGLLNAPYEVCCPLGASTWRSHDLHWFSVLLPPDWRYEPAQGIDSFVGSFVGPSFSLHFDHGAYSNSLPYEGDANYRVHFETVSGRPAKIVASKTGSGVTGIHIDRVRQGRFGTAALTVTGDSLTPAEQAIALQIFRSIRICECIVR